MTKKDFQSFARMIRKQRHQVINNDLLPTDNAIGQETMLNTIVNELVTIFQSDNPKFDAEKFIKACEIDTVAKESI